MNKNYAFIDGNNLYLGAKSQGINIDYRKLRLLLKNKFNVEKAFLFIGYDPARTRLYSKFNKFGFELVHKPTVKYTENGKRTMKGNVDAELVLYSAAIEFDNYNKAVIITSDGDFACLLGFLKEKDKLEKVITPTTYYSSLFVDYKEYIHPLSLSKNSIERNIGKPVDEND